MTEHSVTMISKPRILFSRANEDKEWRFKEKIVAVLELLLQERDDVVAVSPARLTNVVGDQEEADIAFSYVSDPTEFFEFAQVRDRKGAQGRQWLQEVMGQRESLQIEKCRIVSTSSFTSGLMRLAAKQGIPARLLLAIDVSETKGWFAPDHLDVRSPVFELDECSMVTRLDGEPIELRANRAQCLKGTILPVGKDPNTFRRRTSLVRVLEREFQRGMPDLSHALEAVPEDNSFHEIPPQAVGWERPELAAGYSRSDGVTEALPIEAIVFRLKVCRRLGRAPITKCFNFVDPAKDHSLAKILVAELEGGSKVRYACVARYSKSDGTWWIGGAFFR